MHRLFRQSKFGKLILCTLFFSNTGCAESTTERSFPLGTPASLIGSGAQWEPDRGTFRISRSVTFSSFTNGEMDDDLEGFYWTVAPEIRHIIIEKDVTVHGHFRVTAPITIEGRNRKTSRIFGTNTKAWARGPNGVEDQGTSCKTPTQPAAVAGDDRAHDCEKWLFGAISVALDAPTEGHYRFKNMTLENPRTYAITAFRQALEINNIDILNTRPAPDYSSNSDGIGGGKGTLIEDVFIDTWDDSIKIYRDMVIRNVRIVHNQNGSPFQFGWSDKEPVTATLNNIDITQGNRYVGRVYNLPLFANSGGTVSPSLDITKLRFNYDDRVSVRKCPSTTPMPLVYLSDPASVVKVATSERVWNALNRTHCGNGTLQRISTLSSTAD
ncbi:hypothetical protein DXV75_15205 [Alteromonas aestuariivivens]|uniref:Right-handed parallel beta-helix repeat-containing protein n=1 Tax=Alteromonas aestuariivivens TaxID=1938339 RepID=A0A3D8M3R4_9ALTE|nr:hypothetical protein [Alteromonas aestuariivivens]RDV24174.1 hypothetical protein DXV75_15205 [Alteromonas aestuariivivens]